MTREELEQFREWADELEQYAGLCVEVLDEMLSALEDVQGAPETETVCVLGTDFGSAPKRRRRER